MSSRFMCKFFRTNATFLSIAIYRQCRIARYGYQIYVKKLNFTTHNFTEVEFKITFIDKVDLRFWHSCTIVCISTHHMLEDPSVEMWLKEPFSEGSAPTPKSAIIFQFFCQKLHENERIWTPGGVPGTPLDPPMCTVSCVYDHVWWTITREGDKKYYFPWSYYQMIYVWNKNEKQVIEFGSVENPKY